MLVCSGFTDTLLVLVGNASPIKSHDSDMRCHIMTFDPRPCQKTHSVALDARTESAAPPWDNENEGEDEDMDFSGPQAMMSRASTVKTPLQLQGPCVTTVDRSHDYVGRDVREVYIVASRGSLHSHIINWEADHSHFSFDDGG